MNIDYSTKLEDFNAFDLISKFLYICGSDILLYANKY